MHRCARGTRCIAMHPEICDMTDSAEEMATFTLRDAAVKALTIGVVIALSVNAMFTAMHDGTFGLVWTYAVCTVLCIAFFSRFLFTLRSEAQYLRRLNEAALCTAQHYVFLQQMREEYTKSNLYEPPRPN